MSFYYIDLNQRDIFEITFQLRNDHPNFPTDPLPCFTLSIQSNLSKEKHSCHVGMSHSGLIRLNYNNVLNAKKWLIDMYNNQLNTG